MDPTTTFIFRHAHSQWRRSELRVTLFDGPDAGTGAPFLLHLIQHHDDYDQAYYYHHEYTAWCQARAGILHILYVHHRHENTDRALHETTVNDTQEQTRVTYLRRFFHMPVEYALDADLERLSPAVYAASDPRAYDANAVSTVAIHDIFPGCYVSVPDEPALYYAIHDDDDTDHHLVEGSFARLVDRAAFFKQERDYYNADLIHAGDLVAKDDGLHTTLYTRAVYAAPHPDSWQAILYEFFCRGVWNATGFRESTTWTLAAVTLQRAFRFRYNRRRIAAASRALAPHLPRVLRREILLAAGGF